MHLRWTLGQPLRIALIGALVLAMPLGARADEEASALDGSYKQSGRLAVGLAQQYESAFRQTLVRLGEVSRQNPVDLARSPLAFETARMQWPVVTYLIEDGKSRVSPPGRAPLALADLQALGDQKSAILVRNGLVLVVVPAGTDRFTSTEIPLDAFTAPLDGLALKGGSLVLLDAQGRSLGRNALNSDDQELVGSLAGDTTTLVSKASLLSLARIPTAGWTVVVRVPLTEAYRGIAVPEVDERTMPYPLYIVKRGEKASLQGVGRGFLLTLGGFTFLVVGLLVIRRRLKSMPKQGRKAESSAPLTPSKEGGLAMLEALLGEKQDEKRTESLAAAPELPLLQSPTDGAAASVWHDTMQAQITFLHNELQKIQNQQRGLAQEPRALETRMESELESLSAALRKRLDFESKRLNTLEAASEKRFSEIATGLSEMESGLSRLASGMEAQFAELSKSLRSRFDQEDRLLASLDQELSHLRAELTALSSQHRQTLELHESKLSLMDQEVESYRNQGAQASRQANERLEVLAKGLQELHEALLASQEERSEVRAELKTLSERVHRVVKLIAKARPA